MLSSSLQALLALALLWIARVAYRKYAYRKAMRLEKCEPVPQYPHKDPFLGYDLYRIQAQGMARGQSNVMRRSLYSAHGHTFESNWIGQRVVSTCDKENIQTVLGASAGNFVMSPLRNRIAKPLLGEAFLTSDGEPWQHARSLAMSVLGKEQAADLSSLETHFKNMLKLVPRDGSTVDLQPLIKRLFIDKGTELILGECINSLSPEKSHPEVEKFLELYERTLRVMGSRLRLGNLRHLRGPDLEWRRDCKAIYATLDSFIDKAIVRRQAVASNEQESKYFLVDKYLGVIDDRAEMRTQLLNVFLAGRDQIAIAMSLLMFALARRPSVWKKIREEAQIQPLEPKADSVRRHSYATDVVKESMRIYSPVLRSIRHCRTDCVLPRGGGKDGRAPVLLQRGTQVEMDFALMHEDNAVWGEDAAEFVPERWSRSGPEPWSYIPFLGGKRQCPAANMAMIQMTYVIIRLAQEFETLENRDPVMELVDDVRNVRQSKNGVQVALHSP